MVYNSRDMKRRFLLLSLLASLSLTGCDILDSYFDETTPSQNENNGKENEGGNQEPSNQKEATLTSISVVGSLAKTEYIVGEKWDETGLSVSALYSNNNVSPLPRDKYEFKFSPEAPEVDTTKVGVTAVLKEGDLESTEREFEVKVSEKEILRISIYGDLTKKLYMENDDWDPDGLQVLAHFDDENYIELSEDKYTLVFTPSKATYGTTSVNIKARLNNSLLESVTYAINGITVKREYTISFNGNGSTSGSMEMVKTTEPTYTAPSCGFFKDGYSFDKWALNSASGTKYSIGDPIPVSSNITLYATWVEKIDDFGEYYNSAEGKSFPESQRSDGFNGNHHLVAFGKEVQVIFHQ